VVGGVCVVVVVVGGTIQTRHTEIDDVPGPEIPGVAEEPQPELGDLGRELPGHGRHGADLQLCQQKRQVCEDCDVGPASPEEREREK